MVMKHLTIRVEGMVQGVGFRWSARSWAAQLGISGFVRNEDDGSVQIEAEGTAEDMESFLAWCEQGPVSARIDRVIAEPGKFKGYSGFEIRF